MKKFLFIIAMAITCTTTAQAVTWESSCGSKYKKEFFKPNYSFTVYKGDVGGCPSDKKPSKHGWQFSEREEVHSKPRFYNGGKWEWSAVVNIDRACRPAQRSTIVQVHDGLHHHDGGPPSFLAVNAANHFMGAYGHFKDGRSSWRGGYGDFKVPNKPFHVKMIVDWDKGNFVKTQYWIDGQFLGHEQIMDKGIKKLYFKFGVYRVNSNCDITQTYTGVKLRKVK